MTVWVCGNLIAQVEAGDVWEFVGVFGNENDAKDACKTEYHFIGPAKMGVALPDKRETWPGAYYPLRKATT